MILISRLTYAERAVRTRDHAAAIAHYRTSRDCRAAGLDLYCDPCLTVSGYQHYSKEALTTFNRHYQQILWKKNMMTYEELFASKTTPALEAELDSLQAFLNDGGSSVSVADMRMEDALTQELARRSSGDNAPHNEENDI